MIGLLACDVNEQVSRLLWKGVADAAQARGAGLIFYAGGALNDPLGFRRQSNVLYDLIDPKRLSGLIVVSSTLGFSTTHSEMQSFLRSFGNVPIVSLEETFPGISTVLKDDYGGMVKAITHLVVAHGRKRIAYLQGPAGATCSSQRYQAYLDIIRRFGLVDDQNLVGPIPKSWSHEEAYQNFGRLLDDRRLRLGVDFDAVVAVNDGNAQAAIAVLHDRGFRVPEDISVTGFDDLATARMTIPPLTSVQSPYHQLGKLAVDVLYERLGGQAVQDPVIVDMPLVVRQSCGCQVEQVSNAAGFRQVTGQKIARNTGISPVDGGKSTRNSERVAGEKNNWDAEIQREVQKYRLLGSDEKDSITRLCEEIRLEIEQAGSGSFLSVFREVLIYAANANDDIWKWQDIISVFYQVFLPGLSENTNHERIDSLLHQARVMIGDIALSKEARGLSEWLNSSRSIRKFGTQLSVSLDFQELCQILQRELPQFGVTVCCLALYEDSKHPAGQARLVMMYDRTGRLTSQPGQYISSSLIMPESIWPEKSEDHVLVEALYFRNEPLGFVVFGIDRIDRGNEGEVFDALQMEISSAVKAALLHEEVKAARLEAEEKRRSAEEANLLKSSFLSMVSHELRAPLNVIAGLSDNLLQGHPETEGLINHSYHKDVERIHISAQHLDSLIRDVLDLASSHAGELKLFNERMDVRDALQPVIEIGETFAQDKGLVLRVELAEKLPKIFFDRTRLRQVVLNLITNAVKFTEHGEVFLKVIADADQVVFSVQDTGIGIPKEEQEAIFEEFRQSKWTTARGFGGLGLGLAICRKLIEAGGGKIGVESAGEPESGSRFFFTLPGINIYKKETLGDTRKQMVLVLTQTRDSIVADRLVKSGYLVEEVTVEEQEDWLAAVLETPPGAIILDFQPVSEQGWQIVDLLKNNPATRDLPVLFYSLSRKDQTGTVFEPQYYSKPLLSSQLIQLLEQRGVDQASSSVKKILIVDDELPVMEHHVRLIETCRPGSSILQASNGREALEKMQADKPDLVLLDLMMPEMNGFQVLEEMRAIEAIRSIPVIVLTSQKLTEQEMRQLNQGVAAVLSHGIFSAEETIEQIEAVLSRNKSLGNEARRIARRTMAYIHDHYQEPISRKDLAAYSHISPEYLSTCFHRETSISPMLYLERYRLRQAKKLLETTAMTINEIARSVGFSDSSYFSRVFHRDTGFSPQKYRKRR